MVITKLFFNKNACFVIPILLIWHVISSITIDARNSICHSYWLATSVCLRCVIAPHSQASRRQCLDLQRTVLEWQLLAIGRCYSFKSSEWGCCFFDRNIFSPPGNKLPKIGISRLSVYLSTNLHIFISYIFISSVPVESRTAKSCEQGTTFQWEPRSLWWHQNLQEGKLDTWGATGSLQSGP